MPDQSDDMRWYRETCARLTAAYLSGDNPRAQSGHSGDQKHWTQARSLIAEAINRDGTFLDIGCANGFLLECLVGWVSARGYRVEPYGLDFSPELLELARKRLPHWTDRLFLGNAIDWEPPRRYDFVRTHLEYVPHKSQEHLIRRLLKHVVVPGGRIIIGTFNEPKARDADPSTEQLIASWGFKISGRTERPHFRDPDVVYRVVWIDNR
jgi:2-polyprenyl-3-methyl-5-hydroxy-6-metoxy-1,4-benzoquinol methylase